MDFRGVVTAICLLYLCNLGDCGVLRYRDEIQCNWVPQCYYTVENPGLCNIWYPYQMCDYVKVPYEEPNLSVPAGNKPAPGNSAEELIPGETVVDRLKKELDLSEIELNARLRQLKHRKASQYNVITAAESRFGKDDEKDIFSDMENSGHLDKMSEDDNTGVYDANMYDAESWENDVDYAENTNDTDSYDYSDQNREFESNLHSVVDKIFKDVHDLDGDYVDDYSEYDLQFDPAKTDVGIDSNDKSNEIDPIESERSLSSGKHIIISDIDNNLLSNEIAYPGKQNNVQLDAATKIDLPVSVDTTPGSFAEDGNGDRKSNPVTEAKIDEKKSEPEKKVEKLTASPLPFSLHRNFINAPINCGDNEKVDANGKCREIWG